MKCSEVQELLSAYYDGELAEDQQSRLSDHLGDCSECAKELAGFEKLSDMASEISTPSPPEDIWKQLAQQLDKHPGDKHPGDKQPVTTAVDQSRRSSFAGRKLFALAATVLVVAGIGWLAYQSWFGHGEHDHFTAEFGDYLDEFRRDPDAAQQILLAKYSNEQIGPDQVTEQIGYRPAIADGLPAEYAVKSTHVMKMPCCTCVQSVCKRSDGSTLAIFEHDDASCGDKYCCLVEVDDQIAASWRRGKRHITVVGVEGGAEVDRLVAWFDDRKRALPH